MIEDKKILVVDDEDVLRMALQDMLTKGGFEVFTAKDGEEGLNIAFEEKPDLIFIDLIMPIMDGMEMLHKLREDEWGKDAKVIILTNADDIGSLPKTAMEHKCDYLIKTDWQISDIVKMAKDKIGE